MALSILKICGNITFTDYETAEKSISQFAEIVPDENNNKTSI